MCRVGRRRNAGIGTDHRWRAPSVVARELPPPPQRWKKIAEGTHGVCEAWRLKRLAARACLAYPAVRRCLACRKQKARNRGNVQS